MASIARLVLGAKHAILGTVNVLGNAASLTEAPVTFPKAPREQFLPRLESYNRLRLGQPSNSSFWEGSLSGYKMTF
jgi:hypothetical protein